MLKQLCSASIALLLVASLTSACSDEKNYKDMPNSALANAYCEEMLTTLSHAPTPAELNDCSAKSQKLLNSFNNCKEEIAYTMECAEDVDPIGYDEIGFDIPLDTCSEETLLLSKCLAAKYPGQDYSSQLNDVFGSRLSGHSLNIDAVAKDYCTHESTCNTDVQKDSCIQTATDFYKTYKECSSDTVEYLNCLNKKFITCTTSTSDSCRLEHFSLESCINLNYSGNVELPFAEEDDD